MRAIQEAAKFQPLFVPRRTLAWIDIMGITVSTPPNDNHDPRDYLDGKADAPEGDEVSSDQAQPTAEEAQRIAEGMSALREQTAKTNAYERSKYE
jgi:hypothetical protein